MAKEVETVTRFNDTDPADVQNAVRSRLSDLFSKVKAIPESQNRIHYKAGSFLHPYGVKVTVATESVGDATVLKISGRPKMQFLAYVLMAVIGPLLYFGLTYPLEGFLGLIASVVLILLSLFERNRAQKRLAQVSSDIASIIH